jgi:hypothetical protein
MIALFAGGRLAANDRPSFQGLVRDILVLGQRQGGLRKDEAPNFITLVLLGVFGQSMLTSLSKGSFAEQEIRHIIRILVEGIGSTAQPLR